MIIFDYEYSGKKFKISPFTTLQEREILLLNTISESNNLFNALKICGVEDDILKTLSKEEMIAMLYKYREISVGDDVHLKFKCKHCQNPNENVVKISNIITPGAISNSLLVDKFKILTDSNFKEFVTCDISELYVDEYEKLLNEAHNTITKFDFKKPIICQKCKKINYIRIDQETFVIDNMSEDSLASLYKTYNDLVYFGKYTKQDIDTMYPFERTILVGLLNKTRENISK